MPAHCVRSKSTFVTFVRPIYLSLSVTLLLAISAHCSPSDQAVRPVTGSTNHELSKRFFEAAKLSDQTISRALVDGVLDRFHVNYNTIIKTGESRSLGARYVNETELTTRDECMIWCWDTAPCNLAVYEEKTRGSCYLFDCGTIEDFKCKFTQHSSYSSSVLKQNRQSFELKQWGSQSKHEDELVSLRSSKGPESAVKAGQLESMGTPVTNYGRPGTGTGSAVSNAEKQQHAASNRCQHYQFACRNTSDCIAVYNVCDGIPQCPDGSDEATDLYCPGAGQVSTYTQGPQGYHQPKPTQVSEGVNEQQAPGSSLAHKYGSYAAANKANYDKATGNANYRKQQQQSQQQFQPWNQFYGPQLPEYYNVPDPSGRTGNYLAEPDYDGRDGQLAPSGPGAIFWPYGDPLQRSAEQRQQFRPLPQGFEPLSRQVKDQQTWLSDFPSTYRSVQPPLTDYLTLGQSRPKNVVNIRGRGADTGPVSSTTTATSTTTTTMATKVVSPSLVTEVKSTTSASTEPSKAPTTERIVVKQTVPYVARLAVNQVPSHSATLAVSHLRDSGSSGRDTNSAVIALTLGLCITAMLVGLVGCRMKSIKRKIARRGGRSLAHDADYLVNGMYL
ncbi:hypothetical protein HDE_02513 [Halotydeus destructor]|nr:hypothetical protein HDE_02513 [Halotydeus destructor]